MEWERRNTCVHPRTWTGRTAVSTMESKAGERLHAHTVVSVSSPGNGGMSTEHSFN